MWTTRETIVCYARVKIFTFLAAISSFLSSLCSSSTIAFAVVVFAEDSSEVLSVSTASAP